MNPARSADDCAAVIEGLADGTLEILASHAPHCAHEKDVEFDYAPFGITGLETELAVSLTSFTKGHLELSDRIATTVNPARLNLPKGTQGRCGCRCDGIDPDAGLTFDASTRSARAAQSPLHG